MTTNREPFVTDEQIKRIRNAKFSETVPIFEVRDIYEAELSRKDAEIEALRNPWISTKDRLPDPHVLVCLLNEDRFWSTPDDMTANVYAVGWLNTVHGQVYWSIPGERGSDVSAYTHWMPLPTPPTP
jgi:hypothetical protein